MPNDNDTQCSGLQVSPCDACYPLTYHTSVWLSFEPLFLLFLGAFYGPVPLLIIIADIHPVLCANYYPPPTNIRSEAEPRKFLSSRLIEYYLNEPPSEAPEISELSIYSIRRIIAVLILFFSPLHLKSLRNSVLQMRGPIEYFFAINAFKFGTAAGCNHYASLATYVQHHSSNLVATPTCKTPAILELFQFIS